MQDLQVGFTAAMTELSKIQDEDRELHEKLDNSKKQHEIRMKDVYDLVQKLQVQTFKWLAQVQNGKAYWYIYNNGINIDKVFRIQSSTFKFIRYL